MIGRDAKGVLRKARGYTGYITMKIKHGGLEKMLRKTMALAQHVGVGRGRGIGLGEISVLTKQPHSPPQNQERN